jgi:nitrate/TMAO reductase-like tetraheme cytochrome c subunit
MGVPFKTCRSCHVGHSHNNSEMAKRAITLPKKNNFQRLTGAMRFGAMFDKVLA